MSVLLRRRVAAATVGVAEHGSSAVHNTHGARVVSRWAAGAPLKSFWVGLKLPDEDPVPIGAYRSSSCGYLELYARQEFARK